MSEIFIVGSINQDFVVNVARRPEPGETVSGADLAIHPGGKGANQATAASLLGASVAFLGCVGDDVSGKALLAGLRSQGVDVRYAKIAPEVPTGAAFITVTPDGDNAIVVSPGANYHLGPSDIDASAAAIKKAKVLVLQLEIRSESVERAAEVAASAGVRVILNCSPAQELPGPLLQLLDPMVVNEYEATLLLGNKVEGTKEALTAAPQLLSLGPRSAIITLGSLGAVVATGNNATRHFPAPAVRAVDTTAAGDAFIGALAAKLAWNVPLEDAAAYAVRAGAAAVTKEGAQSSLPNSEVVASLRDVTSSGQL